MNQALGVRQPQADLRSHAGGAAAARHLRGADPAVLREGPLSRGAGLVGNPISFPGTTVKHTYSLSTLIALSTCFLFPISVRGSTSIAVFTHTGVRPSRTSSETASVGDARFNTRDPLLWPARPRAASGTRFTKIGTPLLWPARPRAASGTRFTEIRVRRRQK